MRAFVQVAFGDEHLPDNLAWLQGALGKDLGAYLRRDFYGDHVRRYKKRPIYWLFSSPKGAFQALVYLHRYRDDTVSQVLALLREHRGKLQAEICRLQGAIDNDATSQRDRARASQALPALQRDLAEITAYERDTLHPLASQRLALDLDDGVAVNYARLGAALKAI